MVTQEKTSTRRTRITRSKTPPVALESLIYEVMDGRPLYYRGYEDVLAGHKTPEEIMGSSSSQWVLVSYFMQVMIRQLDARRYWFTSNEAGVHIDHRNNLSHDVAIYDKQVLTPDKISTKYVDVPAIVAVEIDVKADISKVADFNYVNRKTQKLLDSGSERVIRVFSSTQQFMVAEKNADAWLTMDRSGGPVAPRFVAPRWANLQHRPIPQRRRYQRN